MTTRLTTRARRRLGVLASSILSLTLAACGTAADYSPTQLPTATNATSTSAAAATPAACGQFTATQSYDPAPSLDANLVPATIRKRGALVVGVSADTYLFGARNSQTGQIEGFDIDLARALAKQIFGKESALRLRVISAADRLTLLESREIDMVARNMTMTCDRWSKIAFSSEYYLAGQKVLVGKNSDAKTLQDLKGQRVCAPAGTTSYAKLVEVGGTVPVAADTHTGCLVLFQQGKVDAITGDDTVLAGLASQDPYTKVTSAPAITEEPYGLGFNKDDSAFVGYVNRLLEDMKDDGRWKKIYDTWLARTLGSAPAPPTGEYGRTP